MLIRCLTYPNLHFLSFLTFSANSGLTASIAHARISFAVGVDERTSSPLAFVSVTGQTRPDGGGGGLANRFLKALFLLPAIFMIMGNAPGA